MKKKFKKAVAVILTAAMAMTATVPAFAAVGNQDTIEPRDHVMESKTELVDTEEKWVNNILVPGQAPRGESYPIGSYILYQPTGGSMVNLSVAFSLGVVSISVDPGRIVAAGGRGIIVETEEPCLLYVDKLIECKTYAVYERLMGTNGAWNFVGYRTITTDLSYTYHVEEYGTV